MFCLAFFLIPCLSYNLGWKNIHLCYDCGACMGRGAGERREKGMRSREGRKKDKDAQFQLVFLDISMFRTKFSGPVAVISPSSLSQVFWVTSPWPICFGAAMRPSPELAWPRLQSMKWMKSGKEIKENAFLVAMQMLMVFLDENVSVFHEVEQNIWKTLEGTGFA